MKNYSYTSYDSKLTKKTAATIPVTKAVATTAVTTRTTISLMLPEKNREKYTRILFKKMHLSYIDVL